MHVDVCSVFLYIVMSSSPPFLKKSFITHYVASLNIDNDNVESDSISVNISPQVFEQVNAIVFNNLCENEFDILFEIEFDVNFMKVLQVLNCNLLQTNIYQIIESVLLVEDEIYRVINIFAEENKGWNHLDHLSLHINMLPLKVTYLPIDGEEKN